MKRTKSIKRLGHTRKKIKKRRDGVKQAYWVGKKKTNKKSFNPLPSRYHLYDPDNDTKYSANAGDYWNSPKDQILKNEGGTNLWLIKDGGVYKKTVRVKDLKDTITEGKKWESREFKQRRSISRKYFALSTQSAKWYTVDGKGRITQGYPHPETKKPTFTNQWLLVGLANRWGNQVATWQEMLKNPNKIKNLRKPVYVIDLDHGTKRIWGDKFDSIHPV